MVRGGRFVPDCLARRGDTDLLDDAIDQEFSRQLLSLLFVQFALDQVAMRRINVQAPGQAEILGFVSQAFARTVGFFCGGTNFNFPQHLGVPWPG